MIFIAWLFLIAMSGAWFWLCYVYFTQDYRVNWKEMVVWVFLAGLIRIPIVILAEGVSNPYLAWAGRIASFLAMYAILYLTISLRFHLDEIKRKTKILAAHLVGIQLLVLPMKLLS